MVSQLTGRYPFSFIAAQLAPICRYFDFPIWYLPSKLHLIYLRVVNIHSRGLCIAKSDKKNTQSLALCKILGPGSQVVHLEDLVLRLSQELTALQGERKDTLGSGNGGGPLLADPSIRLPPWVTEPQHLSPLLAAYDRSLAQAHLEADEQQKSLATIKSKVDFPLLCERIWPGIILAVRLPKQVRYFLLCLAVFPLLKEVQARGFSILEI